MLKVSIIVALLFVLLPCTSGRAVVNTVVNEDYCYEHTYLPAVRDICYVTKVGTRLVADVPRTLKILKEGVANVVQYLLDVFLSARKVGKIAQTIFAVPIDGFIRGPEIVKRIVGEIDHSVSDLGYDIKKFLEEHPVEAVKWVVIFIPVYTVKGLGKLLPIISETPSGIAYGVVAGLELSGFTHIIDIIKEFALKVEAWIWKQITYIEQKLGPFLKVIVPLIKKVTTKVKEFLKVIAPLIKKVTIEFKKLWVYTVDLEWDCRFFGRFGEWLESSCEVIFHAYRKVVDPLFDTIRSIKSKIFKVIYTALDDLSWNHVRPTFNKYCNILLPSLVCDTIVHFVEDIDKFAQVEVHEFIPYAKYLYALISDWIKRHILDDTSSVIGRIAN